MNRASAASSQGFGLRQRLFRKTRQALRRLRNRPRQTVQIDLPWEFMGSDYGGYAVLPERLDSDSIVYSFGVGEDASFDLALIERFGVEVHAFDPTPKSIEWVRNQALPDKFVFHPYGVADYDGSARFNPPINPDHVSHTMLAREQTEERAIDVPVYTVKTIMEMLGHRRLDLLKLDIEGTEYAVLDQMLATGLMPEQLMLEYHHQFENVALSKTEGSLEALERHGYRIFHESDRAREFSLLRVE